MRKVKFKNGCSSFQNGWPAAILDQKLQSAIFYVLNRFLQYNQNWDNAFWPKRCKKKFQGHISIFKVTVKFFSFLTIYAYICSLLQPCEHHRDQSIQWNLFKLTRLVYTQKSLDEFKLGVSHMQSCPLVPIFYWKLSETLWTL